MELNSIQEIISDISEGKMVVLMDDEDRENEGDLILAAEKVSPEAINFMATHARGLICLALNDERCKRLGLEQMVKNNGTELGTAFTGSIEAADIPVATPLAASMDPVKAVPSSVPLFFTICSRPSLLHLSSFSARQIKPLA
jgi:3,4-dihydroxy 2-butanone 4-phosphate synthase/GTP cyclohydrolase II